MGRSGFPFRDPNRIRSDESLGNRRDDSLGNRRDEPANPRRDEAPNVRRDEAPNVRREARPERRPRPEEPAAPPPTGLSGLVADIEVLLRVMAAGDATELQLERGDLKLTLRRGLAAPPAAPPAGGGLQPLHLGGRTLGPETLVAGDVRGGPPAAPPAERPAPALPAGHNHPAASVLGEREHLLTSPMVGTYYAAPSPKDAPFVAEGDQVEAGQTIGIIEAMKIMNEIEAEVSGRVKRILARDGQGVEYGQPLMVIEEAATS